MASFDERTSQSDALIQLLVENYWSRPTIRDEYGFIHEPHGYETHHSPEVLRVLQKRYDDTTAKTVRFPPDFLLVCPARTDKPVVFLEYKVTTTPRYSEGEAQWDVGQFEADPWEHYIELAERGNRVAILNYCSFHSRPILCDYPNEDWVTRSRTGVIQTTKGSGTDYVNVDLCEMRDFPRFMKDEFGVPKKVTEKRVRSILKHARGNSHLQTRHDVYSPYYGGVRETGWNWS